MNDLTIPTGLPNLAEGVRNQIAEITDMSTPLVSRIRIYFKNGWSISVIRGVGTYGDEDNLFEIAPFTPEGAWAGIFIYDESEDDDGQVLGWCSATKVQYYIQKVAEKELSHGN